MTAYTYARYLSSKKTVDDRALNRHVLEQLRSLLPQSAGPTPRVLEIGAGLGTMLARLADWKILQRAEYVALDEDAELLQSAREWLSQWCERQGHALTRRDDELRIQGVDLDLTVRFLKTEISEFLQRTSHTDSADLLIANAVLDLVELPETLEKLFPLLGARGLYWFTINYDGETIFLPEHAHDELLMRVYNRSMDRRMRNGRRAGDSKTGRRLFQHLRSAGANIFSAGPSDWVVHANGSAYDADEGHFLHHIVHTVDSELQRHSDVPRDVLADWVALRHAQVDAGELVYIAHQLDFVGRARARS